ncbi:BamA/TamA family outer membrane protein [Chlamydiia bacterium]|nr:BamA/TamA family outer membrane protein [Chlamydiia bacterium]
MTAVFIRLLRLFLFSILLTTSHPNQNELSKPLSIYFLFSKEHKLSQQHMDALLSSGSLNTNTKNYWSQEEIKESAETDRKYWMGTLLSHGYWQPIIKSKLRDEDDRFILDIDIDPGTQHIISTILIRNINDSTTPLLNTLMQALKKNANKLATEDNIVATETFISEFYKSNGYPKFTMIHKKGYINAHDESSMTLDYTIDTGPLYRFGNLKITGLSKTKKSYVTEKIQFYKGEIYTPEKVQKSKSIMMANQLFSSVNVIYTFRDETSEPLVDIELNFIEAPATRIGLGLNFGLDFSQDLSLILQHENKNLLGTGSKITTYVGLSQQSLLQLGSSLIKPNLNNPNQTTELSFIYNQPPSSDSEDYTRTKIEAKRVTKRSALFNYSYGLSFETISDDRSSEQEDAYLNLFLNTLLSKKIGESPNISFTNQFYTEASIPVEKPDMFFVDVKNMSQINIATGGPTLEFRLSEYGIFSDILEHVPENKLIRFGGNNNVRGYLYRSIYPTTGNINGGSFGVTGSAAIYLPITSNISIGSFFDIGAVFPEFTTEITLEDSYRSVGLSVMYKIGTLPIYLDIAYPLDMDIDETKLTDYPIYLRTSFQV